MCYGAGISVYLPVQTATFVCRDVIFPPMGGVWDGVWSHCSFWGSGLRGGGVGVGVCVCVVGDSLWLALRRVYVSTGQPGEGGCDAVVHVRTCSRTRW